MKPTVFHPEARTALELPRAPTVVRAGRRDDAGEPSR